MKIKTVITVLIVMCGVLLVPTNHAFANPYDHIVYTSHVKQGDFFTFTVQLFDGTNYKPNAHVQTFILGHYITGTTDQFGRYTYHFPVSYYQPLGKYPLEIYVNGQQYQDPDVFVIHYPGPKGHSFETAPNNGGGGGGGNNGHGNQCQGNSCDHNNNGNGNQCQGNSCDHNNNGNGNQCQGQSCDSHGNNGQGQGPGNNNGQGPGNNNGQGPGNNNGQGQGSQSNSGTSPSNGQGPGNNNDNGQSGTCHGNNC